MNNEMLTYSAPSVPRQVRGVVIVLWITVIMTALHIALAAFAGYMVAEEMGRHPTRVYGVTFCGFHLLLTRGTFILLMSTALFLLGLAALSETLIAIKRGRISLWVYAICLLLALLQIFFILLDVFNGTGARTLETIRSGYSPGPLYMITTGSNIARLGLLAALLMMLPKLAMQSRRARQAGEA